MVCKITTNGYLNIYNGLIAKGGNTPDSTIVFTSDFDDFYGGDTYNNGDERPYYYGGVWRGINFLNESIDENCVLENCILKFASSNSSYGAVTMDNASPKIKDCLFENNYNGIVSSGTSLPLITNCDFVGTDPSNGYGVWNKTSTNTVTAENCWWNHNTGPKNATNNPGGLGERVSDYVDFTPWATQLAKPVLGDVSMNGEVKPFDASLVLQHAVGSITLSEKQQGVADVSGNGMITSYDASLILQYSVGLISKFDPDPLGTKSATNEFVSVSFPNIISELSKNNFEIPVTITTFNGVKSLDMRYSINKDHVKFLGINKNLLPAGISIEAGFNSNTGEVIVAMASAYDLNLNNVQIQLEFEFENNGINESVVDLSALMANDNIMTNMGTATIVSGATTGIGDFSGQSEPFIYARQDGIHVRFKLNESGQDLLVQVVDVTGRMLYRNTYRNLDAGMQYIDMSYSDFDKPGRDICIIQMKAREFSLSKKLLIK